MVPGAALLDLDGLLPALAFGAPREVLAAWRLDEVRPVVEAADRAARAGAYAVGLVAYEAAPAFDAALRTRPPRPDLPLAWFAVHDAPVALPAPGGDVELGPLAPEVSRAAYEAAVEALRDAMGAGVAYQVNHTFRLRGRFRGDPLALHARLRAGQGRGLCATLRVTDALAVVSASPELFLAVKGDRVTARPMKGTARRGRWAEEDAARAAALAASEKDRAENVMIADLLRNDLGRVAAVGSVVTRDVCAVETYRTVHQLTTTVEATLRPGAGFPELLAATFPCGSVTGAPKASAMGLVARHEVSPRGAYCGAVGVLLPGGDAVWNVAIRTATVDLARGALEVGVGGGVTFASSAAAEHDEALAKAAFLTAPPAREDLELVETLRLERGALPLLPRHLARLAASAAFLGFRCDAGAVEAALAREAAAGGDARLRLRLRRDGGLVVERGPLPAPLAAPAPVALAAAPVSRHDLRLFHKTTDRAPYEAARAARAGVLDVLLWNEEGELTEFTIGNVVVERGGRRLTPPREAGLLAGVQRAALLARGEVEEARLTPEDARAADRLWLVNAVRGWVPVALVR